MNHPLAGTGNALPVQRAASVFPHVPAGAAVR